MQVPCAGSAGLVKPFGGCFEAFWNLLEAFWSFWEAVWGLLILCACSGEAFEAFGGRVGAFGEFLGISMDFHWNSRDFQMSFH